jgi:hypothetical protein
MAFTTGILPPTALTMSFVPQVWILSNKLDYLLTDVGILRLHGTGSVGLAFDGADI